MFGMPEFMPFDTAKVIDQSAYVPPTEEVLQPNDPIAYIPFISPRGIGKDEQLVYISTENQEDYGTPHIDKWGLSLYLVRQYIKGGGTVLGQRLKAPDATLANMGVIAKYKIIPDKPLLDDEGRPLYKTPDGVYTTEPEGNEAIERDVFLVKLETVSFAGTKATDEGKLKTELETYYSDTVDADGWKTVPLFMIYSLAAGEFANNIRVRFSFETSMEPDIDTNRFYRLEVSENGKTLGSPMTITFDRDYLFNGISMFPDEVAALYSKNVGIIVSDYFNKFMNLVALNGLDTVTNETSANQIDILFGLTKSGAFHYKYELDQQSVSLSNPYGLALQGGSDGSFAVTEANREEAISQAFVRAFTGQITDFIYDDVRCPFIHVFNPTFDDAVYDAIDDLVSKRLTTFAPLGTKIVNSYTEAQNLRSTKLKMNKFKESLICESAMIFDEYTGKRVRMPSVYFDAYSYAYHCANGISFPFAGNFFKWTGFINGTLQPQSTNSEIMKRNHTLRMNQMVDNGDGTASPVQQITTQQQITQLSEINNVHILLMMIRISLDIARTRRWAFIDSEAIESYRRTLKDNIDRALPGSYERLDIVIFQEAANGPGKNRLKAKLTVAFKNMLKGVDYEFYIV
jgi:hypothetical protein